MSIHELYDMLSEMVRQGPGHVVAYAMGMATLAILMASIHWFTRRPLLRQNAKLGAENRRLLESLAATEADLEIARSEITRFQEDLQSRSNQVEVFRDAQMKLETSLEWSKEENQRLRGEHQTSARENQDLRETKGRLEGQLGVALEETRGLRSSNEAWECETRRLRETCGKLGAEVDSLRRERERLLAIQIDVSSELVTKKESEAELAKQVSELTEQAQRLANFDGKVWEKASVGPVPEFRSLAQRRTPIIALTNLKGGVGKTTLAANLGAILSLHQRVLVIDLDYQGSLTSLCLPAERIEEIRRRGEFVDRLFRSPIGDVDNFVRCCHPVPEQPKLRLVAADEALADVENRVMAQWLLHPEQGDARHILRSYLHAPAVSQEYDYVLLDCPPRLTTACINAFAAADFVLIPVIPDQTSAEAVPRQLHTLENLQRVVCPRLEVLGLVANRTSPRDEMIQREQAIWDSLRGRCELTWGKEIHQFRTRIRQKGAFAEAARADRFAVYYPDVQPMFRDLANEMVERIAAYERQGSQGIPRQPQPAA